MSVWHKKPRKSFADYTNTRTMHKPWKCRHAFAFSSTTAIRIGNNGENVSRHIKGEIMTVWKRNSLCFFPLIIDISTVLINGTCYAWRLRGDCSAPSWNYLSSCVLWKLMRETQKLGGTTYSLRNDGSANSGIHRKWRQEMVLPMHVILVLNNFSFTSLALQHSKKLIWGFRHPDF